MVELRDFSSLPPKKRKKKRERERERYSAWASRAQARSKPKELAWLRLVIPLTQAQVEHEALGYTKRADPSRARVEH